MNTSKKKVISAMGLAMVSSVALTGAVHAANPFHAQALEVGYQLAMSDSPESAKDAEGKCGEGKCGGSKSTTEGKSTEGKCGGSKTTPEGKCGEGKCGASK